MAKPYQPNSIATNYYPHPVIASHPDILQNSVNGLQNLTIGVVN